MILEPVHFSVKIPGLKVHVSQLALDIVEPLLYRVGLLNGTGGFMIMINGSRNHTQQAIRTDSTASTRATTSTSMVGRRYTPLTPTPILRLLPAKAYVHPLYGTFPDTLPAMCGYRQLLIVATVCSLNLFFTEGDTIRPFPQGSRTTRRTGADTRRSPQLHDHDRPRRDKPHLNAEELIAAGAFDTFYENHLRSFLVSGARGALAWGQCLRIAPMSANKRQSVVLCQRVQDRHASGHHEGCCDQRLPHRAGPSEAARAPYSGTIATCRPMPEMVNSFAHYHSTVAKVALVLVLGTGIASWRRSRSLAMETAMGTAPNVSLLAVWYMCAVPPNTSNYRLPTVQRIHVQWFQIGDLSARPHV